MSFSNGLDKRPKLRFPEFDEPYRVVTLGEISFMIKRSDPQSHAPVMMLSAGNGFIMQSDKYSRDNAGQSLKKYILLKKGELAYNHGASKAKQFGCCYELQEEEARIPYVYHCFKVRDTEYTPYVALELNNPKMDKQLKRLVSSSVRMDGLLNISYEEYMSVQVYLPAYSEQKRIADFIEKLDKRTVKQEQLIETLKKYKRGLLQDMFPKKGATVPKLRLAGFTGAWEQRKLGEVVQITMGQSPDGSTYSDVPSDYILVQGNADLENGWVKPRVWTTQITKQADAGDLIMSVRAPAGAMGKTAYNAVIGRGVAAIKGNEFIYQLLVKMDVEGFWKKDSTGSTFESLNSDSIKNAEIKIPFEDEQWQIGEYFRNLDHLITLHQSKLVLLRKQKNGLLQQLFI